MRAVLREKASRTRCRTLSGKTRQLISNTMLIHGRRQRKEEERSGLGHGDLHIVHVVLYMKITLNEHCRGVLSRKYDICLIILSRWFNFSTVQRHTAQYCSKSFLPVDSLEKQHIVREMALAFSLKAKAIVEKRIHSLLH